MGYRKRENVSEREEYHSTLCERKTDSFFFFFFKKKRKEVVSFVLSRRWETGHIRSLAIGGSHSHRGCGGRRARSSNSFPERYGRIADADLNPSKDGSEIMHRTVKLKLTCESVGGWVGVRT